MKSLELEVGGIIRSNMVYYCVFELFVYVVYVLLKVTVTNAPVFSLPFFALQKPVPSRLRL